MDALAEKFSVIINQHSSDLDAFTINFDDGRSSIAAVIAGNRAVTDPTFIERHGNWWRFVEVREKRNTYLLVSFVSIVTDRNPIYV